MTFSTANTVDVQVPLLDLRSMHRDVQLGLDDVWRTALETSAFVGGEEVDTFEVAWAGYSQRAYCIGVGNGTDAIALALRGLEIGPGDEVIVPANTFIATAEGVLAAGASPRFVDVDPTTHLISSATIEPAIGPRTKAIIAVYLHGNMPDMRDLTDFAHDLGIPLIGDAAQAHGSTWRGRPAGSFGVASCFSFYPGKNLGALGDAGAIVTDDAALAERIRSLADHGRSPTSGNVHQFVGTNSRLDAVQAGVLTVKLPFLQRWNERRRLVAAKYDAALSPISDRLAPLPVPEDVLSSFHHYVVRTPFRDQVRECLASQGIETGIHYPIPCHLQEPYRSFSTTALPVAEHAAQEILSLPMFPHLTDDQIAFVSSSMAWVVHQVAGSRG
jgi:dTDP-4-amino-4,6-dideoxygalactose transaminase